MFEDDFFSRIQKHHERMSDEYSRLRGGGIYKSISTGDKVIVAVGLIDRGHLHIRRICTVLQVYETSCEVECKQEGQNWTEWVDRFLIVDVLPQKEKVAKTKANQ